MKELFKMLVRYSDYFSTGLLEHPVHKKKKNGVINFFPIFFLRELE